MSDTSKAISAQDIAPTVLPDAFLETEVARDAGVLRLPRYNELPNLPLYREQVLSFVENELAPLSCTVEGPWLTASMVNNYVKSGLVQAPVKKLYRKSQIARLIVICLFKQFLPMSAIERLLRIQTVTYPEDVAYDYVMVEMENAVRAAFKPNSTAPKDTASRVTRESLLVRSAAAAFASKAYLMAYVGYSGYED